MVRSSSRVRDPGRSRLPCIPQCGPRGAVIDSARRGHGRQRLLLLIPTTTYRTEDFVEAARPPRRGPRGRLRPPEHDGGRVPGSPADPAVRRSGRGRRARCASTRRAARSTPWCPSTTPPPWWAPPSARRSGCAPIRSPRSAPRANKLAMRELLARAGVPSPAFTVVPVDDDPRRGGAARALSRACSSRSCSRRAAASSAPTTRPSSSPPCERIAAILRDARRRARWARAPTASWWRTSCRASRSRSRGCSTDGGLAHAGALRQARSARRAVLRGDDLRHARRGCPRPTQAAVARVRGRAPRAPSACRTGPCTPSCGCDRTRRPRLEP